MALKGTVKEQRKYSKYVGLFTANVIAVNPTKSELEKLLDTTIDKDPEYTGSSNDGNKKVTLSFWLKEENQGNLFNVRFGLEDVVVVSKTGKTQFINTIGNTSYAEDKSQLPEFFTEHGRTIRPARKGEELLYKFLRAWLNNLPYDDPNTELILDDWKGLLNGNTKELRAAIKNFQSQTVGALAIIRTSDDGKEYQAVYSYEFLPSYAVEAFLSGNKKGYKNVDRFIQKVGDREYGCKDYYELRPLIEYDPSKNVINTTNEPVVKKTNTFTSTKSPVLDSSANDDLPF